MQLEVDTTMEPQKGFKNNLFIIHRINKTTWYKSDVFSPIKVNDCGENSVEMPRDWCQNYL